MEEKSKLSRLSKDTTLQPGAAAGESSFRASYYGATGAAVPFKWESQPGTPKHPLFTTSSLPPLTPPPSYHLKSRRELDGSDRKPRKKTTKLKVVVLLAALPRLLRRSSGVSLASYSSSLRSTSSTSSSDSSLYYSPSRSKRRGEPSILMCFGISVSGSRGFGYRMLRVKKAMFSIVGCRRSSHSVDYYE